MKKMNLKSGTICGMGTTSLVGTNSSHAESAAPKSRLKLEEATIADVQAAMESGKLTAHRLVEMYLTQIDTYDQKGPALNAIITPNPNALADADALDAEFKRSGPVGPLHGIPVLVKDIVATQGIPTTAGSKSLEGYVPAEDATIIRRLKAAGAIVIAKSNPHEFSIWGETISSLGGQTRNPYDLTRTPGGSSGGTGAGLAANYAILGIAGDTNNSIRSPSSANSVVGIRPTIGLISRSGVIPVSSVQDAVGPMARTLTDAVKLLNVMVGGYDAGDPATAWSVGHGEKDYTKYLTLGGLKGARLGLVETVFGGADINRDVNVVAYAAIKRMEDAGAVTVAIRDPMLDTSKISANINVDLYDLKPDLNAYLANAKPTPPVKSLEEIIQSGKFSPHIEDALRKAQSLDRDASYFERLYRRKLLQDRIMEIMAENNLDALTFPHQQRLVVPIGERQVERNGNIASIPGFPSIAVPGGFSPPTANAPVGVPVGIEFVGRPWDEGRLIRLAYGFEQATKFRVPPKSAPPQPGPQAEDIW
jgi:amidase